jgi:hypothetical protein
MTIEEIKGADSDEALFTLISRELDARLPPRKPIEPFLDALRKLPTGLRAMAATYELDVSITLDDLGWHFGNWHHTGLGEETIGGLRELGAQRMAELTAAAFEAAQRFWAELGAPDWSKWYHGSPLEELVSPLNREAGEIYDKLPMGLYSYWLTYARQNSEKLVNGSQQA